MNCLTQCEQGVVLAAHVVPRASANEITGLHDDVLRIRLKAPPVDGKANEALIHFLAEQLDVPRRDIHIVRGTTGRKKRVLIKGRTRARVERALSVV